MIAFNQLDMKSTTDLMLQRSIIVFTIVVERTKFRFNRICVHIVIDDFPSSFLFMSLQNFEGYLNVHYFLTAFNFLMKV